MFEYSIHNKSHKRKVLLIIMNLKKLLLIGILLTNSSFLMSQFGEVEAMSNRKRAEVLLSKGQCVQSMQLYKQIYSEDSAMLDLHGVIRSYTCLGELEKAESMLNQLIFMHPNEPDHHFYLALNFLEYPKEDSAILHFKTYIELYRKKVSVTNDGTPIDAKPYFYIGNIYRVRMIREGLSKFEKMDMIYHIEEYLRLNPVDEYGRQWKLFIDEIRDLPPENDGKYHYQK
jgi:tetratricopeptide (TPR) repeat protein